MLRVYLVLLTVLICAVPALADVVSQRPDKTTVTLYHSEGLSTSNLIHPDAYVRNEGLAFITETRTVDLPAGPSVVRFRGVVSTIVPQTAEVQGLPAGVAERNFDYDLLTPGSLLAKSIGETVHLVRTNPKTGKKTEIAAVVRSAPNGTFLESDGKLEALDCSGLPEKLVFDRIPPGLADTPTLSVRTNSPQAGRYKIKLSYIATALNWSADYVARVARDGRTLDLTGWLTLANFSDNGFKAVPLEVVAGRLNTTDEDHPVDPQSPTAASLCWPTNINWGTFKALAQSLPLPAPPPRASASQSMGEVETVVVTGSRIPDPRLLGDYKLYALPEPATLAARETKQIQFLDQRHVEFEKTYRFDVDVWDTDTQGPNSANIVLRLVNNKSSGLGKPLPAGAISVMAPGNNGVPVFVGQHSIKDVAVGSPAEFEIGRAMDVQAEYRLTASTTNGSGDEKRAQKAIEITISNGKPVPIHFEIRQPDFRDEMKIISESQPHIVTPAAAAWDFNLAPHSSATLDYTVDYPSR